RSFFYPSPLEGEGKKLSDLPHLPAVAEQVVGEDQGHHGFADRDGADADAGVVAALGGDLDLFQVVGDAAARLQDGGGGLHGEAHHHRLAGGDAAQHAAGLVGEEDGLAVLHADLVGVLLAAEGGGGEA